MFSEILFYLKLAPGLKNNGFIINPNGSCVAKKLVKGEVMTLVGHVDDLKVLHMGLFEVTKFSQYLFTVYRNKLKLHGINICDYLGMYLDYSDTELVNVLMIRYLKRSYVVLQNN